MVAKTYEQTEECTVQMSKMLATLCKPYSGCPRGMTGHIGFSENESEKEMMMKILLINGRYILKGVDEDFVCIPRTLYEQLLDILQ